MGSVELEKKENLYTITLNRPEVRNAFNDEMISEMTSIFKSLHTDSNVRVVVLKGAGESFSAGGDLNWMKSMVAYTEEENIKDSEKLYEMYEALTNIPVPVICVTHGHAMGGGLGLMAASDICLGVEGTQYCFSEVRLGLAPAVISSFVAKKMHSSQISRYFLTAEVFGPSEAKEMGLLSSFGTNDEIKELTEKLCKKIMNNGPKAVRETKKLISDLSSLQNPKSRTCQLIASLRVGTEGQEGLKAFFEKRKPNWLE